jgi:hypothetical protein
MECPVDLKILRATIGDLAGWAATQPEYEAMLIRTTTDPITLRDVPDPASHPHLFEGDERDGLLIHFESEENKRMYEDIEIEDHQVLVGDSSEDYVAEG